jgi:four helix bundle protein
MSDFKQLKIWEKGFEIAINGFKITKEFPSYEKYALGSQIIRAGTSIPSNIAEGSSRKSQKDYNRFIQISLGSSFELETQLLLAKEIKCGNLVLIDTTLNLLYEEEKMLSSFSKVLTRE